MELSWASISVVDLGWIENHRAECTINLSPVAHDTADTWLLDLPVTTSKMLPSHKGKKKKDMQARLAPPPPAYKDMQKQMATHPVVNSSILLCHFYFFSMSQSKCNSREVVACLDLQLNKLFFLFLAKQHQCFVLTQNTPNWNGSPPPTFLLQCKTWQDKLQMHLVYKDAKPKVSLVLKKTQW